MIQIAISKDGTSFVDEMIDFFECSNVETEDKDLFHDEVESELQISFDF